MSCKNLGYPMILCLGLRGTDMDGPGKKPEKCSMLQNGKERKAEGETTIKCNLCCVKNQPSSLGRQLEVK